MTGTSVPKNQNQPTTSHGLAQVLTVPAFCRFIFSDASGWLAIVPRSLLPLTPRLSGVWAEAADFPTLLGISAAASGVSRLPGRLSIPLRPSAITAAEIANRMTADPITWVA